MVRLVVRGMQMDRRKKCFTVALLAGMLVGPTPVRATTLGAVVTNDGGEPVSDAVVFAIPLDQNGKPAPASSDAAIDQVEKEYVPYVTPVRVGTRVSFPNRDQIRHHVYSFSDAKSFEIPLYKGTPREPILFDKAGPVTLGCNIHDWMTAYVFVTEAPYFSVTEGDGRTSLSELPAGEYSVRVWHPRLRGDSEATAQRVTIGNGSVPPLSFTIREKNVWRPRRAPSATGGGGYR